MKVAEYIAETLKGVGVTKVYMLSGTGSIHLDDAFANKEGIEHYCARHEATAVMMAQANAKLTNNIGLMVSTTGPGAMNALSGLMECWVDSIPVMVISGQEEKKDIRTKGRSFGIQGLNIIKCAKSITKYAVTVEEAESIRYHLERAIHEATSGRQGPVWIDIPTDIQSKEIDVSNLKGYEVENSNRRTEKKNIGEILLNKIKKAKKPVIIIGQGAVNKKTDEILFKILKKIWIPIIATRMSKNAICKEVINYVGMGGIRGNKTAGYIINKSDLVIGLGTTMSKSLISNFMENKKQNEIVIVNNERREEQQTPLEEYEHYETEIKGLIENLEYFMTSMEIKIEEKWEKEIESAKKLHATSYEKLGGNPINSYYLTHKIEEYTNSRHIIVSDAGSSYYITGQALKLEDGQRELTSGAFASMGVALGLAIGAATTDKSKQVLVITGDGSIELNIQELKTISQYNLDIKIFVINNGGYASIRESQDSNCGGRYTEEGEILDFEKISTAFDLAYLKITDYKAIGHEIKDALKSKEAMLIELICDQNQKMDQWTTTTI